MPSVLSVTSEMEELQMLLAEYQADPALFVREVIQAKPDPWQEAALRALVTHKRVTISACHGPGKDAFASWAVLWVLCCFEHPKVPCTAPTGHQLYDLLWAEVAKWRMRMLPWFAEQLEVKRDRIELKEHPDTWFAAARTARKENPEGLQGFHADVILVVCDEASGIPDNIFEVLEGALTGPLAFCILIGNPTQTTGYFYDSHHRDRDRWQTFRVMAAAAHEGGALLPGVWLSERVSPQYVANMAKKYGRDSNVFRVRVLGQFPTSEADRVVPFDWIEAARLRPVPTADPRHYVVMGVDVARMGEDDSALVVRQGGRVMHLDTWHGHDVVQTAGRVVAACRILLDQKQAPIYIFVDGVGVGAGVVDVLRANEWLDAVGIAVIDVQAGASSPDEECQRLRDALWWRVREAFDPQRGAQGEDAPVFLPSLDAEMTQRLVDELASPKFAFTPSQLVKVESKDEMKRRGVESPDLADAYVMTFYVEAGMPEPPRRLDWHEEVAGVHEAGVWT